MISSKRPIVVYIEQARIPDETTSITRSEVPITGDIVVHHRIQNGANNKAMGDGFLKELYDVLNGAVGENLRFEDGASVFVYTSCARSIENYEISTASMHSLHLQRLVTWHIVMLCDKEEKEL